MENDACFVLLPMRILFSCFILLLLSAVTQPRRNAVTRVPDTADTLRNLRASDTTTIFACPIEVAPQFPGGYAAQKKFITDRTYFPNGTEDIQGRVLLSFKVDKCGSIDSIKVLRQLHPKLDSVAVAIIKQMPPWEPARLLGQPKAATMVLPIKFIPE